MYILHIHLLYNQVQNDKNQDTSLQCTMKKNYLIDIFHNHIVHIFLQRRMKNVLEHNLNILVVSH